MNFTFLNGAFLFAALAALLPLIIHLISRRRVATLDFSSLRFLKELERRRIRRVRLRQLLLLIIRSLIILLVALALARPTLSGALGVSSGSHARTSVAIVLDNSASMSREGDGDTLLSEALGTVGTLVGLLDEGDQAFLLTAERPPRAVLEDGTFSPDVLLEAAGEVSQDYRSTDYVSSIRQAMELLSESRNPNRELYVIGDMQRPGWAGSGGERRTTVDAETEPVVETTTVVAASELASTRAYLMPVSGPVGNLSLSSVQVERSYGASAGLFSVVAGVTGFDWRGGSVPARLFVDGVQVGQAGVEVSGGGTASARFSVTVDETAWHAGRVELPPDAMAADNTRYFVIPRSERTEVLLVRNSSDDMMDDAYFIERALDPTREGASFACSVVDANVLADQDQGRFSVVVLADVARLDLAGTEWLGEHIENGGGVLLVLGNRTDIRFWNSELLPELAGTEALRPIHRPDGVRLAPSASGHPILEGLVFGERLIDDIYVRRAIEVGDVNAEDVLELPGIGPALFFTYRTGTGEVGTLTIGVDPSWSDLPRSGFVVPLLHRVVARLADAGARRNSVLVGEDVVVRLPRGQAGLIEAEAPDGSITSADKPLTEPVIAAVRGAEIPGVYRFRSGDRIVALGAVNVDPTESELAPAGREEISAAMAPLNWMFVEPGADVQETVLHARHGRELWRVFLYAALLLVAIEMVLARQRYT